MPTRIDFARSEDREQLEKIEALSEKELIQLADPSNEDESVRYDAIMVLSCNVIDDKNLIDLYWLALEELRDAVSAYRRNICTAILRAERAKTIKGGY